MVIRSFFRTSNMVIAATAAAMLWAAPANSTTIYSNNFASNANGFTFSSGTGRQTSPNGTPLLGYFTQGGYADLSLTGLQAGATETLTFDLYALITLDGSSSNGGPDYFTLTETQNGTTSTLFNQTFANNPGDTQSYPTSGSAPDTGAIAVNTLGYTIWPGDTVDDATYALTLQFVSTGTSADVRFIGNSNEAWANEGYGIGNVVVSQTIPVAEPTSLAILGAGLAGIIGLRRRVRA